MRFFLYFILIKKIFYFYILNQTHPKQILFLVEEERKLERNKNMYNKIYIILV